MKKWLAMAVAAVLCMCSTGCDAPLTGPADTSVYQYAVDGKAVYYAKGGDIYKENAQKTMVIYSEDTTVYDVRLYNDTLYYYVLEDATASDDYFFEIRSISTDGKNAKDIVDSDDIWDEPYDVLNDWMIDGDTLYMQFHFELFRMDMTTGEVENIHDDVQAYHIRNNVLYFIEHANRTFTIYKMDLESTEIDIVFGEGISEPDSDLYSNFVIADSGEMIYTRREPYGVYLFNGSESKVIEEADTMDDIDDYSLACENEYVYYVARNDAAVLKRYDIQTHTGIVVATLHDYQAMVAVKNGYCYYENTTGEVVVQPIGK